MQLAHTWPNAEVLDHYRITELGPVAVGVTGARGGLCVLEERYFVEVPDASERPVAEGEPGELVLTPLGRSGCPLFRYQTGDLVRPRRTPVRFELEGGN